MKKKFRMALVEDPTGSGRKLGACTEPGEPLERIFLFWFKLVPTELVGTPEETAKTTQHRLKVVIAANRLLAWNLYDANKEGEDADREGDLSKLAFWIGKSELEERMATAEPQQEETVSVHAGNFKPERPYDTGILKEPVAGAVFELEVERRIRGFAKN